VKKKILVIILWLGALVIFITVVGSPFETEFPDEGHEKIRTYILDSPTFLLGATRVQAIVEANAPWRFRQNMSRESEYVGVEVSFPPAEVWCVLLESVPPTPGGRKQQGVFFIGLHDELYQSYVLIHEGESEPFSAQFLETLAVIGCDLDLTD
jgi:hypothetical protein